MTPTDPEIRAYFGPPSQAFWRWQDGGDVIGWADGLTIAFHDELLDVLRTLAPRGLPPLGAVLLVLAACRESWASSSSRRGLLASLLSMNVSSASAIESSGEDELLELPAVEVSLDMKLLSEACDGLEKIHALPWELRTSRYAKAQLCAQVFEGLSRKYLFENGVQLTEALEQGLSLEHSDVWPTSEGLAILRKDLACLRVGAGHVDAESLARRVHTGLGQRVLPAPIEVPTAGAARDLIARLQNHEELGVVARLARRLMAAVQLPRPVGDPEDLPLGGVSDISHRGPLDRLLLSELANDDLSLAVRVATNEALYLRRESPPHIPPRQRIVLMDAGIRLWGVPRVFSAAVGLALAAAANSRLNVQAYRANGANLDEIDFSSEQGLADHLAALDYRAHPGEALEKWREVLSDTPDAADAVLVTGEDVLEDAEFQVAMQRIGLSAWHVATVNREGRFRLILRTALGGRVVREAQLWLDEILTARPAGAPLYDATAESLPAAVLQRPLPLRVSASIHVGNAWHVAGRGVLSITNDGRLLYWAHPARGAQELAAGLPPGGRVCWCDSVDEGSIVRAVVGRLSQRGLYSLTVDLGRWTVSTARLELDGAAPQGAFSAGRFLFVVYSDHINILNPVTGALVLSRHYETARRWWGGRFFKGIDQAMLRPSWHTAAYDGTNLLFENVSVERPRGGIVAMFDAPRSTLGPVALMRSGEIVFSDGARKSINLGKTPIQSAAPSRDGLRLAVSFEPQLGVPPLGPVLVYVLTGQVRPIQGDLAKALEPHLGEYSRPRMMRSRFRGIAVDASRRLVLESRRQAVWPLQLDKDGVTYRLTKNCLPPQPTLNWIPFQIPAAWENTEHAGLRVARWPDGSRAILDSRGLLHLKSSDDRLPEFSVVLADGESAGWCSDGRWWGSEYFRGEHTPHPLSDIYAEVIAPFLSRLT